MYGIDSYVLPPPLSALVSVTLLAGCDGIGLAVLRASGLCAPGAPRWHRWQAPIAGAMVLAIVLYPLALVKLTPLGFMSATAGLVAAIGIVNVVASARTWSRRPSIVVEVDDGRSRFWRLLLMLLLIGAAVMSLGPPTDSDSLDYHLGVPVGLLVHGGLPFTPEWLHSRLAASQEMLNAMGLAGGTDNFGAVLQFAGMAGIAALLVFADSESQSGSTALQRRVRLMAAVVALSAPTMVSLIAQKPQLLPIAMTSFALALVIYPSRRELTTRAALQGHTLICLLVTSAAQAKLSFMLTGGIVGLLSLGVLGKRGRFWPAVAIGAVIAAIVLLPPVLWKQHYFHDSVLNSLLKSMPGDWPGSNVFDVHLRGFTLRSSFPYPLLLFLTTRLNSLTIMLGPAIVILLTALRPRLDPWAWVVIGAVAVVWVVLAKLGPMLGRYYIEPCLWLLMLLVIQPQPPPLVDTRWITWPVVGQALFTIALFWYGAVMLFPGALTARWRSVVMDKNANGYRAMKWVDSVLPPDAVLLSANRSIALAPRDVVSFDWASVVNVTSRAAEPYLIRLKERGVTHVLMGTAPRYTALSGCIGAVVAGPGDDPVAVRNPLAEAPTYPVWVYRFNAAALPDCAFIQPMTVRQ
jgi:hypothetical protein